MHYPRLFVISPFLFFALLSVQGERVLWVDQATEVPAGTGSEAAPFKTLSAALKLATPGTTVRIHAGTYRESLRLPSGKKGQPIKVVGVQGERVVVTGMDLISQWEETGNGQYAADINWQPIALFLHSQRLPVARAPGDGWWEVQKATATSLADPAHLKNFQKKLAGGEFYVWTKYGNTFFTVPIQSFHPASGEITFTSPSKWMKMKAGDRYYLKNHPSLIRRPGDWAVQKVEKGFRLTFMPADPEDLKEVEAPRRNTVFVGSGANHVQLEGLEITGAAQYGVNLLNSEQVSIRSCILTDCGRMGLNLRGVRGGSVSNNIVFRNEYGISLHSSRTVTVERNEIAKNRVDGLLLTWGSSDITVRQNYIHHHSLWGHPDNVQLYRDVKRARFIGNVLLAGGQSVMMEQTEEGEFRGNLMAGASAVMLIFGHKSAGNYRVTGNTLAFAGYGCMSLTWKDYEVRENVFVSGHPSSLYSIKGITGYSADRNLFWNAAGLRKKLIIPTDRGWHQSFDEYRKATDQDAKSIYANPGFCNAPAACDVMDKVAQCTRDKLFLRYKGVSFQRGDQVEIDFDGLVRKVAEKGPDWIHIAPPLSEKPVKAWVVLNWKKSTDFHLDLRLKQNSPGATLANTGGPVGSTIDLQAYQKGDFDGDGQRDLPTLPEALRQSFGQPH